MITVIFGKQGSGESAAAARFIRINNEKKDKYYKKISKSKLYKKLNDNPNKFNQFLLNTLYPKNFYDYDLQL